MNDTISRQAVIDLLKQMRKDGDMVPWEGKDVFARIRKLPSAQPERMRGKWIDYVNSHCECSVCHTEWSYFQNETECFEFCPNCGADMRGKQDDSF